MDRIEREETFPVRADELWESLADLSSWFGAHVTTNGTRMEFLWPDGTVTAAVLEENDPPRKLAFRWMPFARLPDGGVLRRERTRVEITLDDVPEGTLLRVVEASLLSV